MRHAYEYTVREDILMSLEYHDLEEGRVNALLKSRNPLQKIFQEWESRETGYMDMIWDTVQEQAKAEQLRRKAQKER